MQEIEDEINPTDNIYQEVVSEENCTDLQQPQSQSQFDNETPKSLKRNIPNESKVAREKNLPREGSMRFYRSTGFCLPFKAKCCNSTYTTLHVKKSSAPQVVVVCGCFFFRQ